MTKRALISAFAKMPLYFLHFKTGSEFFKIQPLSLSVLVKNYFSVTTLINKHSETKNIINTGLLSLPPVSEVLMRRFPDLTFFPVLPLPSLPVFPSHSEIYDKEHLKSRKLTLPISSPSDRFDLSINAHKNKDKLSRNSEPILSDARLNTEEFSVTASKDFSLAKSGLTLQEPGWIISTDEKRNNRVPATQLRPLRWKIEIFKFKI